MPNKITIDLIRRRAEHNEGLIHTLEELSLHQEELESIDDTLGCNCRRLKILYLQNNIIGKMQNLHHMKELEYLNLALNNISKVEGLQSCEFLNKLDLTVNFVDMDELENSVSAMEGNRHLKDLYMMGNPCQSWAGFEAYTIARLPQLERLDGKEITRTDRIKAQQRLPALRKEIPLLAQEVRQRKLAEKEAARLESQEKHDGNNNSDNEHSRGGGVDADDHPTAPAKSDGAIDQPGHDARPSGTDKSCDGKGEEEELTKHTPEARTAIYREMAEQKREKEERQKENLPKDRNFELEQAAAVERARKREAEGTIRQCNEAKLEFRFEETGAASSTPGGRVGRGSGSSGDIVLEVAVPKHLDSSLIDLDVHPHYVSVVIKGKVLRLSLQAEVKAGEAKARRSKTTGSLVVTMPKVDPDQSIGLIPTDGRRRAPGVVADRAAASKNAAKNDAGRTRRRGGGGAPTLAALMMEEAQAAAAAAAAAAKESQEGAGKSAAAAAAAGKPLQAVSIRGMVGPRHGGLEAETAPELSEVVSSVKRTGTVSASATTTGPSPRLKAGAGRGGGGGGRGGGGGGGELAESQDLPAPPPRSVGNLPRDFGQKMKMGVVPPAPPSGSIRCVEGEGTNESCPRGSRGGGAVAADSAGRNWLEEVD